MSTIAAKIDVTKIDKARLFQGKNGAMYLDLILIASPDNKYGNDYMVVQGVTKEERQAGTRGAILGNAKILGGEARSVPALPAGHTRPTDAQLANQSGKVDSGLPF